MNTYVRHNQFQNIPRRVAQTRDVEKSVDGKKDKMAVLCGMSTIQYSARSARLSVC